MNTHLPQNPAQLLIGSPEAIAQKAIDRLQQALCATECGSCNTCAQIARKQHHATIWITPENQYTLEHLSPITQTMSFSLDANEQCFFILEHADFLTPVCANALLKPLEEPPPGYNFILLAQWQDRILPTIRSRCVVTQYTSTKTLEHNPLLKHFIAGCTTSAQQFLQDLEKAKPNERLSIEWIDALLAFWIESYKTACIQKNTNAQSKSMRIITALQTAYKRPIMPGSAKLFWKHLFLRIRTAPNGTP